MIKIKKGDHVLLVSKNTYEVMYKRLKYEMVGAKKVEEPAKVEEPVKVEEPKKKEEIKKDKKEI